MQTTQSQIKLNLPVPLKELLASKARGYGVPMASYIRHLIIKDVESTNIPTYQASTRTEKQYRQALKDIKNGTVVQVNDVGKFFDEL